MSNQYKRAFGVLGVRTAAEVKIRRAGFLRNAVEEADAAAQPPENRYHGNYSNNSWYQKGQNEEQFREYYADHS